MRHRIGVGAYTGLGNPDKALLNNTGKMSTAVKNMAKEAIKLFFKKWGGCDYDIGLDKIKFGVEPAYFGEDLKIIVLNRQRETSFLQTGHAFGMYGSGIKSKYRFYSDYKKNGKFKRFVDRWHPKIFQ